MLARYQPNFASLSPEETALVACWVARRHPGTVDTDSPTGDHLFRHLTDAGLSQADVVLSVAPDPSPAAVLVLEKLVGRPITRPAPPSAPGSRAPRAPRATPTKGAAVRRSDPRRIAWVGDNPKKPGSASHARFALYVVGMTVDEFVRAGGTTADVKWDTERGFVKMEEQS